jgi:hypothetical protein
LGPRKEPRYTIFFTQKVPASEFPPASPTGPLGREIPTYRAFFTSLLIYLYLSFFRVPGKGAFSVFPNRVPKDRDTPSPEPLVYLFIHSFIHVCLLDFPEKEPSYIWGKMEVHCPRSTMQTEAMGCSLVPQGDC